MVHRLGQAAGAYTDGTHGMTLAAVSLPYYKYLIRTAGEACVAKFARFATEVWGVSTEGEDGLIRNQAELAFAGLDALEAWMNELGLVMSLRELGADEDMIDGITEGTFILDGGYKVLTKDEIREILRKSL